MREKTLMEVHAETVSEITDTLFGAPKFVPVGDLIKSKIEVLLIKEAQLKEAEDKVKNLKADIVRIEEHEIPDIMSEFQLQSFETTDGFKVKLSEQVYTHVHKEQLDAAYQALLNVDCPHIFKPTVKLVFDAQLTENDKTCMREDFPNAEIEFSYAYHHSTLSAAVRALLEEGKCLDSNIFKQSVRRSVKLTQPKTHLEANI